MKPVADVVLTRNHSLCSIEYIGLGCKIEAPCSKTSASSVEPLRGMRLLLDSMRRLHCRSRRYICGLQKEYCAACFNSDSTHLLKQNPAALKRQGGVMPFRTCLNFARHPRASQCMCSCIGMSLCSASLPLMPQPAPRPASIISFSRFLCSGVSMDFISSRALM